MPVTVAPTDKLAPVVTVMLAAVADGVAVCVCVVDPVAAALITNVVLLVIDETVAPVATPNPNTGRPALKPVVDETVIVVLSLVTDPVLLMGPNRALQLLRRLPHTSRLLVATGLSLAS